ncbi:MAG TPA: MMPL family transporter, partial [Gaiellaceae bacterium]|nr:MMPL family transporter [Gaiellaceae bacterium]
MAAWTRFVLRHRGVVLAAWLAVLLAGGFASTKLSAILSNTFAVPGTDSEQVRQVLQDRFGDRSDGAFTIVFELKKGRLAPVTLRRALTAAVRRAASAVPSGAPATFDVATAPSGRTIVYGDVDSTLDLAQAKGYTPAVLAALGHPAGIEKVYVTGAAAIQHDLDPIFNSDLRHGELEIAVPIALLVLLAVFGFSWAVSVPIIFAGCTITGTLGIVYGVAQLWTTPTYATNLVQLIGLGIAVDYSLLVVYRFREELAAGKVVDDAVVRTMQTAGRAVVFSGIAVALGLALLVAMPLPFIRMLGVAGFLIPIVSILAAVTLQPVLLSYFGRRGTARHRILRREPIDPEDGLWARLARSIMKRPIAYLIGGTSVLLAAAVPAFWIQVTPGSSFGIPRTPQSVRGFDLLREAVGPGAVAPAQIVVEAGSGSVLASPTQAALRRLIAELRADPEVAKVYSGSGSHFVDSTRRYEQVIVAGRHDYGFPQEQALVKRLRSKLIPEAGFPVGERVLVGGAPGQGVDFLHQAYTYFVPLIAAVLVLTYFLLMRAFRSLLLPLKAVLLNLLSVGASYGMLVVFFRWGLGHSAFGLYQFGQVEGWIPIFLFAMLFGLSMDYEVFLVTRMRESWDEGVDNVTAVAHGLERTGRIITAAAIIMCAAFSGFIAGRIVGLQEFGLGLAVAIFVDATIVRCLLVPSLMAVLGRWNWWLPAPLAG